jgi:hypothetical protein
MSAPWLKFYPSDWRADPALRMCSLAARGLWMEMLCLMHEAVPRASLLVNGLPIDERQLAALCGVSVRDVVKCLDQLEAAGVFSREVNRTIYSRRMRRDEEKAERDKANGKGGGNPSLKGVVNPPDKAQIPEARVQKPEPDKQPRASALAVVGAWPADAFDQFWTAYPEKVAKKAALRAFAGAARTGVKFETLMFGLDRYKREKPADRAWCHPTTWLNGARWADEPSLFNGENHGAGHRSSRSNEAAVIAGLAAAFGDRDGEAPEPAGESVPRGRVEIDH